MLHTIDNWLGDVDLVRFLERQFTYKTPHYYIEYADSTNAPRTIFSRRDDQETNSQIFYSTDFDPNDIMIKFLVIKAMETVEDLTGIDATRIVCERAHLTVQHPGQDVEVHQDGGDITAVYTAACPGGGDFIFEVDGQEKAFEFEKNRLFVFDGSQRHRAPAADAKRPRILLVIKFGIK